ncbi:hypothetical protein GOAMR_63_00170 [Gordonia amarae NBRC 15530]|uniref:Uncharacterized protein n=1 Tax=Gordonia amarae NBRC 15530 TaxID=1075090 RepID=G7GU96_9ACTN|nr:hypothetical protein GOAMR_63_00170 [Gordonia amarae NBRC 15530]
MPLKSHSDTITEEKTPIVKLRTTAKVVLTCLALALTACSTGEPESAPETTTAWGPVGHETAPFRKHFPDLGVPISASWLKGNPDSTSTDRIQLPSPPSTVLSAIVEVRPDVAQELRSTLGDTGTPEVPDTPDVAPELRSLTPDGPFVSGESNLGTVYGWDCVVHVDRVKPVVVIRAFLPWATSFTA